MEPVLRVGLLGVVSTMVAELGKAFGGVVAVLGLVAFLAVSDREREAELRMVYDEEPRAFATSRFLAGERVFYECWRITTRSSKEITGAWFVPGEARIPVEILARHPERRRLERSWHIDLSEDSARFSREAWGWAERYNLRLAELTAAFAADERTPPGS
jgi:hypothetical protein